MVLYYFIAAVIAGVNLGYFIYVDEETRINNYCKSLTFIMFIACLGYLALGMSTNVEEALLANKVSYVAGAFMPPIMVCCICTLFNLKINKWIRRFMFLYSGIVYAMVLTTGYSTFYYKSYEFTHIFDAATIAVEKGPGYTFFLIILYGQIVTNVTFIVYAYIKDNLISRGTLTLLTLVEVVTIVSFIVGRQINDLFEVMPAVYAFDGIILQVIWMRVSKYHIDQNVYNAIMQNNTAGYILVDDKNRYIGANKIAHECLPELDKLKIDTKFPSKGQLAVINDWIADFEADNKCESSIVINKIYYEIIIKPHKLRGRRSGLLIELEDHTDRQNYLELLANYNAELEEKVDDQTTHIKDIQSKVILGMADMVESRDNNTGGHIRRTSEIIRILIDVIKTNEKFDLSDQFCQDLIKAAPMHDLGKIGVDDKILRKTGRFTPEEFEEMKTHSDKSAIICENILRGVEEDHFVDVAVNVARFHHEKWNGTGYPQGLSGNNIPLEARIMAIVDVYDALVSKRCYKDSMSFEEANKIMIESMGTHFDPSLKTAFELARPALEQYYMTKLAE